MKQALELAREGGLEAIVARNLGKKLDTAPSTIFTHFNSVEDIRQAVIEAARELYNGYVEEGEEITVITVVADYENTLKNYEALKMEIKKIVFEALKKLDILFEYENIVIEVPKVKEKGDNHGKNQNSRRFVHLR